MAGNRRTWITHPAKLSIQVIWPDSFFALPRLGALAYFDPTIAKLAAERETPEALESLAEQWRGIVGVPEYFLRRKQ